MSMRCFHQLVEYGVNERLAAIYPSIWQSEPQVGYNVTLAIPTSIPASERGIH
jgi:hypothetical protein